MSGWLIRSYGKDSPAPTLLYAAADSNPAAALSAVQKLTHAVPRLRLETVGELSDETLRLLGLAPGQVRALSA